MTILVVVAVFLLFIGISYWRERNAKTAAVADTIDVPKVAENIYLHPSHTFARIVQDEVWVGMDAFAQKAFGQVTLANLPRVGQQVQQGDLAWQVRVRNRSIGQRIPVDGQVVEIDEKMQQGWAVRIKASHLQENLANLINNSAINHWLRSARTKFLLNYAGELAPAMQDGGELVDGFASHLNDDQWRVFCQEFFNSEKCE